MCGICGYTGKGNEEVIQHMSERIRHRGPDEAGFYENQNMHLCSRRLSIVDIKDGRQPVSDEKKEIFLIWNGECYNHHELRRNLEYKGHHFFSSHSDTETLLHMYMEYGVDFVKQLNGMFAIAIWDRRCDSLFLFRDRMGVKPLFYSTYTDEYGDEQIMFASEIKALLAHPCCDRKINDKALYEYFSYKHINAPSTAYQNIYEMMPGQKLCFKKHHLSLTSYWSLRDYYKQERIPFDAENAEKKIIPAITEKLDSLMRDAVSIRMRADVPVGSFLSGGLDSSLVSVLASSHTDNLSCFTLGHEVANNIYYDKQSDVKQAEKIARSHNMETHLRILTADDVIRELPDIVRQFDAPFSGAVSTYFMAEEMSKHVKTALSGDGADELFGSYLPHMLSFPMEFYVQSARLHGNAVHEYINSHKERLRPMEENLSYLSSMYDFSHGDESLLSLRMLLLSDAEKAMFLNERFSSYAKADTTLEGIRETRAGLRGQDVLNRNLEYDSQVLLPNEVLRYSDMLSMAHSLEIRSPFLDYRIVEYLAGISGYYKLYHGETKYLLKQVASRYLPPEVVYRKKEGFVMPVNDWLPCELKEFVLDTLSLDHLLGSDYLNAENVYFMLMKYYSNPEQNAFLAGSIWNMTCFQLWIESL
jgi:asparagine synthase (glutamine-hydrolysing)